MSNYFLETQHHEWILTNDKGGYALATGNLVYQRKYHGLLIGGYENFERRHLVSSLEEKIEWRGVEFHLDSNNYSHCIFPEGFQHLVKSWLRPHPTFLYSAVPPNDSILILKEIFLDHHSNTVVVRFTNMGNHLLHFTIRPKLTLRDHHVVNMPGTWDTEQLNTLIGIAGEGSFRSMRAGNRFEVYGFTETGTWNYETIIYRNVFYPWEVMRGYDGSCDLIAPLRLDFDLKVGESNHLVFADKPVEDLAKTIHSIVEQYEKLPRPADFPVFSPEMSLLEHLDYEGSDLYTHDAYLRILEESLKDFIIHDDIVRGWPWFPPTGRDTMIFLQVLEYLPRGVETAWAILMKYGSLIHDGLVPAVMGEGTRPVSYEGVDASFWFIIRLQRFADLMAERTYSDIEKLEVYRQAIDLADQVIKGVIGHKHLFTLRTDGLIDIHPHYGYATWMDSRIGDRIVTPRDGAPVEVNALWYSALCHHDTLRRALNKVAPPQEHVMPDPSLIELRDNLKESLGKFWNGDYLADRLIGDERIDEMRPNAIIACSLPEEIWSKEQMTMVYEKARRELLTAYGIRTLSPEDYRFKKKYLGSQVERDLAYHQGTNWAWLLLPYLDLYEKVHRDEVPVQVRLEEITAVIFSFRNGYIKGHIASVAEVWDGDHPHFPKGSPAMALSVAALYLAEKRIRGLAD